jgi:hypothetical protein
MQFSGIQTFAGPAADNSGQVYGFVSSFQNFGATRTGLSKGWHSIAFYQGDNVPNNVDFSKPRDAVEIPTGIVGPNASVLMAPVTLKPSEVDSALKKDGIIVIWGHFDYRDIYDPDTQHYITFCQRLTPTQTKEGLMVFAPSPFRSDCNVSK